jgi:hypothetical protein
VIKSTKQDTLLEGIDYDEFFAPVARYTPFCTVISLASVLSWKLLIMDIFLNVDGFVNEHPEFDMTKLMAFNKSSDVSNLYSRVVESLPFILLCIWLTLFFAGEEKLIVWCKRELISEFKI